MYGSIGKLGRAGIPMTTNQAIAHAVPNDEIVSGAYLFWYLRSARRALVREGKGGTQQNISQTVIKSFPIPLAPRDLQDTIAEDIEEQWSRVDDAVAKLQKNLMRADLFRESILAVAFGLQPQQEAK
jgi:type I restriction enzyme S subunit